VVRGYWRIFGPIGFIHNAGCIEPTVVEAIVNIYFSRGEMGNDRVSGAIEMPCQAFRDWLPLEN